MDLNSRITHLERRMKINAGGIDFAFALQRREIIEV